MKQLTLPAYAKINLYLSVLDKRPDGYHNIESVMQSVSLADAVTVTVSPASGAPHITLTMTDNSLPCDAHNIAYRAAELFLAAHPTADDIGIHIVKNIPVAGGLAGGSTDGAAVLRALNTLYGSPFTTDELCRIGAALGADVPFCIRGGTMLARGVGEILSPLPPLPDCTILIVRPHESVSTPEAYRRIDSLGAASPSPLSSMTDALRRSSIADAALAAYNIFESVMPASSEIHTVKRVLDEHGAILSMMSGSGPSVFAVFGCDDDAVRASQALSEKGYVSVVTAPVSGEEDVLA